MKLTKRVTQDETTVGQQGETAYGRVKLEMCKSLSCRAVPNADHTLSSADVK